MRTEKCDFMSSGVAIPRPVAYDRLRTYIKSINMGTVLDLQVSVYC